MVNVATAYMKPAVVLSVGLVISALLLGFQLGDDAGASSQSPRTVTVVGSVQRDYPADIVIWPVSIGASADDLTTLLNQLESDTLTIQTFLGRFGLGAEQLKTSPPQVVDKMADYLSEPENIVGRYVGTQKLTIRSSDVDGVRLIMPDLIALGKQGILFVDSGEGTGVEYHLLSLDSIKTEMSGLAMADARDLAQQYADGADSELGKPLRVIQSGFEVADRDSATAYIKTVSVHSTVEYQLQD